ncbi:MAG TPA: choline/ethanolamine kinase family protein, partial [Dongiaceae bacterium]
MPSDVAAAIARIPLLARPPAGEIAVETLPGLTNRNYKITARGESYVLRLPGAGTENYIDRAAEAHDAALAARAGLTPEIVFIDPAGGLMLTRFVDGAETLTAAGMHDPAVMADAARMLRRLHDSGLVFRREMRMFEKIDSYLAKSPRAAAQFGDVRRMAERLREVVDGPGRRLVPCHIDPTPNNFIRGRGPDGTPRMYLIDWEYAEMSEPAYDLAGLSIEAEFSEAEEAALLRAYGEGVPGATPDRFAAYKAVLYLMAGSWAAMAIELGN